MQLEVLINMANFNQGSTELGYIGNILQSGGNWNNGSKAGLSYLNSNNGVGNSSRLIGARLELRMFSGERAFYEQPVYPHRFQVKHTTYDRVRLVWETAKRLARMLLPAKETT